jgi:hypothetical protein
MAHTRISRASGLASWAAASGLAFVSLPATALTPVPVGAEFQVNTFATGDQVDPAVAAAPDGSFVVVWDSPPGASGTDQSSSSIQGQRYASDGSALGAEFQVNTFTPGGQVRASVAMADAGDFVVVWATDSSGALPGFELSVQGQRFASDGSPQGTQFQVNTVMMGPADYQLRPSVASAADGSFVVVWQSGSGILGRRFASDGSAQGGQFQINTHPTGGQNSRAVAAAPNGDFFVVWTSNGSPETDTSGSSVQGRRYASDGSAQGGQFQVNSFTTGSQFVGDVAAAANGDFVVAWSSDGSPGTDTSGVSVQGQRYASDGSAQGGQFQINTYTTGTQIAPAVSAEVDGDFVVVWLVFDSPGTDTSNYSVWGQRFASNGSARGAEFQVNSYTAGNQWDADVARSGAGGFVVAWQSDGSSGTDTSGASIQGQRFSIAAAPLVPALSPSATSVLCATLLLLTVGLLRRRSKPAALG